MMKHSYLCAAALACSLSFFAASAGAEAIGAPSPIPHPVKDYLPITLAQNNCLACHREAPLGRAAKTGEIPRSHYTAEGKLSGERYECMVCHAESSSAAPLAPTNLNEPAK